jgi:hypothetical protein
VPLLFRGYRVRYESSEHYAFRASPVVSVRNTAAAITVAVPEFWQQFPKAIEVDGQHLYVRLFPKQFGDFFELQGGEQKTHTVWFDFQAVSDDRPHLPLDWVVQPARVHVSAEMYAESQAVPFLTPAGEGKLEHLLHEVITGDRSFFARREIIDEYGWRHYGEIYADHEGAHYQGPPPVISHFNNQYDCVYGALLQYLRAGNPSWFELADSLARHVVDIDIYHTNQDRAAYNGGLFWPTDHYKDAFTATHRTYSAANCRPGDRAYGGGPCNEHNYSTGLLHHYFLTGDPASRAAVMELANWVVNMDDGSRSIVGLADQGPTGLASRTRDSHYHGPGRGCGNSINTLLDAWLLTDQSDYLAKAEELIRRSIHPADDVEKRGLLDVENRWSYTVFLSVLSRYLLVKAEARQLDYMYAYAQASLLQYASWMLENELPYFDRPEQLEYPTETWAAQELRKANVLRLAAVHADEPLRSTLCRRGDELAERAWADLMCFPSRTVARSVALLMVEGIRDCGLRMRAIAMAPRSAESHDFGAPSNFLSQRQRVFDQLKTGRGVVRAVAGLADPRRWYRLFFGTRSRSF